MKPLYLEIQAFGPFAGKETIDFTLLHRAPLFLISGPTGSGKTTIFDSITFALFGEASGSSRDIQSLRSDFAKESDACYVEFHFLLGEEELRVIRAPAQRMLGKSDRMVDKPATASLEVGSELYSGPREVNAKLQELLNLTVDQFRQIVMLPQGEFKELLEAPSATKEQIFRKIFRTQIFDQFKTQLGEQRRQAEQEFRLWSDRLDRLRETIEKSDPELTESIPREDMVSLIDALQKDAKQKDQKRADIEKKREKEETDIRTLETWSLLQKEKQTQEEELERLEEASEEIESLRKRLLLQEALQPHLLRRDHRDRSLLAHQSSVLERDKQKEKVLAHQEEKESLEKQRQDKQTYFAEIDELEQSIDLLKKQKNIAEDVLQKNQQRQKEEELATTRQNQMDSFLQKKEKTDHEIQSQRKRIDALEKEEKKSGPLLEVSTLTLQMEAISKQLEESRLYDQLLQEDQELLREQQRVQKELDIQREVQKEAKREQALRVLLPELEEGMPCPLCGSREHPSAHTSVLTEDAQEDKTLLLERQFALLSGKRTTQLARIKEKEVFSLSEERFLEESERLRTLQEEFELREVQLKAHEERKRDLQLTREQLEKSREEKSRLERELERLRGEESRATQLRQELCEAIEKQMEVLPHSDLDQYEKDILSSTKDLKKRKEVQETLSRAILLNTANLASALELMSERERAAESARIEYEKALKEFTSALEESGKTEEDLQFLFTDEEKTSAKDAVKAFDERRTKALNMLSDLLKRLEKLQVPWSKDEIEEVLESKKQSVLLFTRERDALVQLVARRREQMEDLCGVQKGFTEASQTFTVLEDMYSLASGKKEAGYVSFETFVLMEYYEEVIAYANIRLKGMSAGRYAFVRSDDVKGGGRKGLDLSVFDYFTGKERSVKTLSGGESFKASLALALGLSDAMESRDGGIRLDTLFIDEGFGSLDADSLNVALDTLLSLRHEGRLIGVISHVEELRTVIPAHLEIHKSSQGSKVKLLV